MPMAFDPSKIKKSFSLKDLPEGSSRSDKVTALAEHLHERGLTASLQSAKRLAEGMVDTERKIIDEGSGRQDASARREFQKSDLYREIGGVKQLDVPDNFQKFIDRAKNAKVEEKPREPTVSRRMPDEGVPVMYDEAPSSKQREEIEEVEDAQETWRVPEKKGDEGYEKTQVDVSEDGVVVRHTERTAQENVVQEEGVVRDAPEKKKAPEEDIDLFDIFKN